MSITKFYLLQIVMLLTLNLYSQDAKSVFSTDPTDYGHTWSITSRLGDILHEIEEKYGARDKSYTILGVETTSRSTPQIWFPGSRKHVIIQITENCQFDLNHAIYQVAHEAIHCLNPVPLNESSVLEEGLATYFSSQYCLSNLKGNPFIITDEKYSEAHDLVEELILLDPECIKKIRRIEPSLSKVESSLILRIVPTASTELACRLTSKFR